MGQFKIGDKVKIIKERGDIILENQVGMVGDVVNTAEIDLVGVKFSGTTNSWYYEFDEVELFEKKETNDKVNPLHYKKGDIECIDAIRAATVGKSGFEGYLVGNVIKYLWRFEDKGGVEDLKKASWYLNKLIE